MKTFVILFAIAISLPSEAQRVKENVKQRVEIAQVNDEPVEEVKEAKEESRDDGKKKDKVEKAVDALRKR